MRSDIPGKRRRWIISKRWLKIGLILALILLPYVLIRLYEWYTAFPKQITLAGGPAGGLYRPLMERLASEIERQLEVKAITLPTNASLDNLKRLQAGEADLGLYQPGTLEIMRELDPDDATEVGLPPEGQDVENVAFIANLYLQPAHLFVRRGSGIRSPTDLEGKTVNLGVKHSGNKAMSLVLLKHFGLDKNSIEARYDNYSNVKQGFLNDSLDAAFISIGVQTPIFPELFATGKCFMLSVPYAEALAGEYVGMSQYKIPAGRYRYRAPTGPATDIETVALGAQLLARSQLHPGLVKEVTRIVLSEEFLKENQLAELFSRGRQFAQEKPEFAMHKGAKRFYSPDPQPLLPADFVEATEGIRSFAVSVGIAIFFLARWLRKKKEHKLERYMQSLLDIERRQVSLGAR